MIAAPLCPVSRIEVKLKPLLLLGGFGMEEKKMINALFTLSFSFSFFLYHSILGFIHTRPAQPMERNVEPWRVSGTKFETSFMPQFLCTNSCIGWGWLVQIQMFGCIKIGQMNVSLCLICVRGLVRLWNLPSAFCLPPWWQLEWRILIPVVKLIS